MIQDGKVRGFAMGQAIAVRTDYSAGEDWRHGSSDAAGLGDPVQRAGSGWSYQYSFSGNAAQAQLQAQGLSRPNRRGGSDPCDSWRGALASVRSDHAAA